GEGADASPPLKWSGLPAGTKELALICDDPDAPTPKPWVHWVLYRLAPTPARLQGGGNGGGRGGGHDVRREGYGGAVAHPGHGVDHYHFKLYALDRPIDAGPGLSKEQLLAAMKGRILAEGELVGTYERK